MNKQELFLQKNHFSTWLALKHHKTHKGKMLDFSRHSYLKQIYLDKEDKSSMKSTQSGFSESLIVESVSASIKGYSVFYVLPTIDLIGRFVQNRFNKSVKNSKYYSAIVKEGDVKDASRISLQHVGSGSIAFVGSNAPSAFTEYPADLVIIDELDRCNQENIMMAWERLSESELRRQMQVSQPTIHKFGIHKIWEESCKFTWFVQCECGHRFNPDLFKNVLRQVDETDYVIMDNDFDWTSGNDISLICDKCGKPVDRYMEGEWIKLGDGVKHCYHISKLFSTRVSLIEIVDRFNKGLANPTIMQRVYNGDLGLPFTSEGNSISELMLDKCVEDYLMAEPKYPCVMGVDVGSLFHIRINEILPDGRLKAVYIGSVKDPEDVEMLYAKYGVLCGVIDANPERRISKKLCNRLKGMFMCFYGEVKNESIDTKEKTITVIRTSSLDNVLERVISKGFVFPKNIRDIKEYYQHMTASVRIYDENSNTYRWVETGADHFFHAEGYSLIAKNLLVMAGSI